MVVMLVLVALLAATGDAAPGRVRRDFQEAGESIQSGWNNVANWFSSTYNEAERGARDAYNTVADGIQRERANADSWFGK